MSDGFRVCNRRWCETLGTVLCVLCAPFSDQDAPCNNWGSSGSRPLVTDVGAMALSSNDQKSRFVKSKK